MTLTRVKFNFTFTNNTSSLPCIVVFPPLNYKLILRKIINETYAFTKNAKFVACLNISGVYQCGPASVEAVKCGAVGFNFDVTFMLSTVNADLVRWKEDDTSEFNYSKIDSNKYQ